jgi:hypothetical protein
MKYIEKSRLETFLKSKGYTAESPESDAIEQKSNTYWYKSEQEKVSIPKQDVFKSNELPKILSDSNLLNEFRRL